MKHPNNISATFIGGTAVLMWATLALLTTLSGNIPAFQLAAMTFTIAFLISSIRWMIIGNGVLRQLRQPAQVWLIGTIGLFGYHFFYFMALQNAPPVEAGLIAYMWPLLIVVGSALLPGETLRWWHVAGALSGFAGTILLVTEGQGLSGFKAAYTLGYLMACLCALTWTSYSLLSRRLGNVSSEIVGGYCGATALLATLCHFAFETTIWPQEITQWLAILGLGLGPVGAAFFTWDIGVKRGNIQILGAFSYAAPLLSTILLLVFGVGEATWIVAVSCLLIIGGAVLASKEMFRQGPSAP